MRWFRFVLAGCLLLGSTSPGFAADPTKEEILKQLALRQAFNGEWDVASVKAARPARKGEQLLQAGEKLRFAGDFMLQFRM